MNDAFGLAGRCVLVTGGTRGIGRAISLRFARAGAAVIANYARNDAGAESLAAEACEAGLALETLRADLTLPKGLAAVHERIDALDPAMPLSIVHCAATGVHRPFEQLSVKHWDWTQSLNVRAFFELVKLLLPRLGEGSALVAVSSAGAERAVPAYATVGASKAALESLARHLAVELAPRGIRVNILSPGSVQTDAWDAFPDREQRLADALRRSPRGRLVGLDEVAHAAQFLCSTAASGMAGQTLVVDGGTRILE
ncbi:SDR family oxidoreductase [uncultured Piscinibacter sp.]|uniref:SDR family oxidoreductase n=1 Tax=uncultured Piscinibacter sp. TaxID=1131835 RepID=UPI0026081719|nr:SDR family oxidoreductase [uncultured Piscinibacter sp.]